MGLLTAPLLAQTAETQVGVSSVSEADMIDSSNSLLFCATELQMQNGR